MQLKASPGWTRAQIVAAIKDAGFTLEGLSEIHELSKSAVSTAISKPWPAVEKLIAETIGVAPHKIWPPRYSRKGVPIKRGGKVKSSGPIRGETFLNNRSGSNRRRAA